MSKNDVKEIIKKLEEGVSAVFKSENYMNFLRFMASFHNYSFNNQLLIFMQKPDATLVAGYQAWKKKNRQVKKGEKGIQILAPQYYKTEIEKDFPVLDENNQPKKDEFGQPIYERKKVSVENIRFVPVYVFDISQTDGDPIPSLMKVSELNGSVPEREPIMKALQRLSPFPITFENIQDGSKGYCDFTEKKIAIKEGMSDIHTIKTAIHEVAHSLIHQAREGSRGQREVEAESIAFVVCNRFGLDTSDYSFGYIAGWSGKKLESLKESLQTIQETSQKIINEIESTLEQFRAERDLEHRSNNNVPSKLTNPLPNHNIPEDVKLLVPFFEQEKRVELILRKERDHSIAERLESAKVKSKMKSPASKVKKQKERSR